MNRKGNIVDIFDAQTTAFSLVIVILISVLIIQSFNTGIQSNPEIDGITKGALSSYTSNVPKGFDYAFAFVLLALIVISAILARTIESSPTFYVFAVVWCGFIFFLSILLSNIYVKMVAPGTAFADVAMSLPIINFVMPRLIYYGLIYFAVVAYALYTKDN